MTCDSPGAVTADELVAYADGEAPARVAEHVRTCAACAEEANRYRRAQRRLRGALDRFECPTSQTLGEYELGLLSSEERQTVAAHVLECPLCSDELRLLRQLLAEDVASAAPAPRELVSELRRVVATLVRPPAQPAYALRGLGNEELQTYQAGDVTIAIGSGPAARRGRASLTGLVWREGAGAEELTNREARLSAEDGTAYSSPVDDLGNFVFEDIRPGPYRLEVWLADRIVVVELVRAGE